MSRPLTLGRLAASAAAVGAVGGYGAAQWYGRTYGSTRDERTRRMPGDDLVADPQVCATHATTIDAPPERVWPWLVQVGWHRGGWYTARWVDGLLFPANWPSATRIVPELQDMNVGDFVPDGTPESGCGFVVRELQPERHLVLHSTTHLPRQWRDRGIAAVEWTWVFVLDPLDDGQRTRFVFRWRLRAAPWWLLLGCHAAVVPADLVMSRDMMRGLRARAERAER